MEPFEQPPGFIFKKGEPSRDPALRPPCSWHFGEIGDRHRFSNFPMVEIAIKSATVPNFPGTETWLAFP
jgi:hypothetical protein